MVAAADRARASKIEEVERQALYARLLDEKTHIGRRALTAIRKSPVMRNHRGEWTAPADMVMLKGEVAKFMAPVVSAPSKEMVARADLLARLRIRKSLETADLIAGAAQIAQRPERAERFERLLADNQRLIIPAAAKQLFDVPFLRGKSGVLAAPRRYTWIRRVTGFVSQTIVGWSPVRTTPSIGACKFASILQSTPYSR